MIGKVLGNRYEIIEKIGGGGMSVVYKAKCKVLNRYVAIKILRNEFTSDPEFIEKFKQESLSAASLNHPNIVNIYDTGIEGDIYYIVMEYIKGKTLKEYISKKGKLSEKEAVKISIQVAEALKHAHTNKIIHRDIKPHNILLTEDGIAKVTDFGIARAATTSTINNTSNVIGSVHYFSPEQARGGYVDEKSDIYSLGIVMYEMITGTVPFDADNHISVAMKHIQDQVIPPSQKVKNIKITNGFEAVILKCLEKHQSYRYQNATDLLKDLYTLQNTNGENLIINKTSYLNELDSPTIIMPKINSKMLNKDIENLEKLEDFTDDSIQDDTIINEDEKDKAFKEFFADNNDNENDDDKEFKKTTIILTQTDNQNDKDKGSKSKNKKDKKNVNNTDNFKITLIAILSALAVTAIIAFFIIRAILIVPEVVVPNFIGKTEEEARTLAKESGLLFSVQERAYNSEYEEGLVFEQNIESGQKAKKNYPIEVSISKGTEEIIVPNILGKYLIEAKVTLKDMGLEVGETTYDYSDNFPSGQIIKQIPEANTKVSAGSSIAFIISKGPQVVYCTVPTLIGLDVDAAKAKILEKQLKVGQITYENSDEYEKNIVIRQSYNPGVDIEEQTKIDLVVSLGKKEEEPDNNTGDNNSGNTGNDNEGENDGNSGDNSDDNPETLKFSQINIPLPDEKGAVKVIVYRITEFGDEIVYEDNVNTKDGSILVTVSGNGTQYFKVYVDGVQLVNENNEGTIEIKFD